MGTQPKVDSISRRCLFRAAAAAGASIVVLAATAGRAIAKVTQKGAGYQAAPKDDQKCSTCALFKAPDSCTLVDGAISPDGWCRLYAKKAA